MKRSFAVLLELQPLEGRVVLSFSFSSVFHTLLSPLSAVTEKSVTITRAEKQAHVLAEQKLHEKIETRIEAREAARAEHHVPKG